MFNFPNTHSHIRLFVENEYKFSFGYPVLVEEALETVKKKLQETTELAGEEGGPLLISALLTYLLNMDFQTTSEDIRAKVSMMLCGVVYFLAEKQSYNVEPEKYYQLNLKKDEDDIIAELHLLNPVVS
jgi:hypothetical protein